MTHYPKLINYYYWTINPEKGEALAEIKLFHLGSLCFPDVSKDKQQPFIEKADIMLSKNKKLHKLKNDFLNFLKSELGSVDISFLSYILEAMKTLLRDCQWVKVWAFLKNEPGVCSGKEAAVRLFTEAILWIMRSGAQWRLLPQEYGKWNSVCKRFAAWSDKGVWERFFTFCASEPDMELLIPDSTVIRAYPCAAGALRKDGGQEEQALGRSRGGFGTKIHIAVDALGNPLKFILTPGQNHDITQAEALTADFQPSAVPADKGYDSDPYRQYLLRRGIVPVIPPRSNRKNPQDYDQHLYKERHLVECFINKIKHFRHIFSRFDKLAKRYLSFLHLAGALIWLR